MYMAHFVQGTGLFLLSLSLIFEYSDEKEITCGSHFTSRSGTISSPNYPDKYSPNSFCVWTISVIEKDPEIKLVFSNFNLPGKVSGKCNDIVSIYKGLHHVPSQLVQTYCGSTLPSVQVIQRESVRIEFSSDDDDSYGNGFLLSFRVSTSNNAITTSQATAGIVAAIFCGIVFIGVATMRCIMMGACPHCHPNQAHQPTRELVGTNETMSNYVMDCPPSYRTVMEHPESFPTPNITPYPTPTSSPRVSQTIEDEEPPPPYSRIVQTGHIITPSTAITAHHVAERLISGQQHRNAAVMANRLHIGPTESGSHSNTDSRTEEAMQMRRRGDNEITDNGNNSERTSNHHELSNRTNHHNDNNETSSQSTFNQNEEINNRETNQNGSIGENDQNGINELNNRINNPNEDNGNSCGDINNAACCSSGIAVRNGLSRSDDDDIEDHSHDQYLEIRL